MQSRTTQSRTSQARRSVLKCTAAIGIAVAAGAGLMPHVAEASLLTRPAAVAESPAAPEVDQIRWYGHGGRYYGGHHYGGHRWHGGPGYGYGFGYKYPPYWYQYGYYPRHRYY